MCSLDAFVNFSLLLAVASAVSSSGAGKFTFVVVDSGDATVFIGIVSGEYGDVSIISSELSSISLSNSFTIFNWPTFF